MEGGLPKICYIGHHREEGEEEEEGGKGPRQLPNLKVPTES